MKRTTTKPLNPERKFYEETYVSLKTAKLLKERGFNYMCNMLYNEADKGTDFDKYIQNIEEDNYWWCPSQAIVMKWLREEHKIVVSVYPFSRDVNSEEITTYTCDIATPTCSSKNGHLRGVWKTYEECCEAAIQYALERENIWKDLQF